MCRRYILRCCFHPWWSFCCAHVLLFVGWMPELTTLACRLSFLLRQTTLTHTQVFRNMVDAQIYAERTGHTNFEECEEEVREKTAEEKAADRAALLKRIKENKVSQQVAQCTESPPPQLLVCYAQLSNRSTSSFPRCLLIHLVVDVVCGLTDVLFRRRRLRKKKSTPALRSWSVGGKACWQSSRLRK